MQVHAVGRRDLLASGTKLRVLRCGADGDCQDSKAQRTKDNLRALRFRFPPAGTPSIGKSQPFFAKNSSTSALDGMEACAPRRDTEIAAAADANRAAAHGSR